MKYLHTMVRVTDLDTSCVSIGTRSFERVVAQGHSAGALYAGVSGSPGDESANLSSPATWDPEPIPVAGTSGTWRTR